MSRKSYARRLVALTVGLVAVAVFAGAVLSAQFDGVPSAEEEAALRNDAAVHVVEIPAAQGSPARGVFVQPTSTGLLCLWDAPSASAVQRQGGCNAADDPLAGRTLTISLAFDGGPAVRDVTDARLIGLVSSEVAAVQVLMSDGSRRAIPMRRTATVAVEGAVLRAFGYRFPSSDRTRGVSPTAVLTFDRQGAELDRLTTGYGS